MIRVQNQQQVECLSRQRVDVIRLARHGVEHVQQIAAVVEIVARVDERLTQGALIGGSRDRRQLGDDAMGKNLTMTRIIDVHRVVVERRHRGDDRADHGHRMRVVMKAVVHAQQRLVDHRVPLDVHAEFGQLLGVRQLTVQQEIGYFDERAMGGQLLDGITAVHQYAGIAVDVGDLALGARRRHEARIEGEDPVILVEGGDVDHIRTDRACTHGQVGFLTGRDV